MGIFSRWIDIFKKRPRPVPGPPMPSPVPPAPVPSPEPIPQPAPVPVPPSSPGRLVKVSDGPFHPRLYSYWANAVVVNGVTQVFAGHVADGAMLYGIAPNGVVSFSARFPFVGTTEGWYWDARSNGWLYIADGPRLLRYNPMGLDGPSSRVVVMDISSQFPNCRLWQCHSSDDGTVHSATVQSTEDWRFIATVVWYQDRFLSPFYPKGQLDESQITPDGKWLIIKETNEAGQLFNRLITLPNGPENTLGPSERLGHSDCGPGYMVGEDSTLGAAVQLDMWSGTKQPLIHPTWNMGHVSVREPYALFSRHELGQLVLMDLRNRLSRVVFQHGVVSNDYDVQVRANLSPCGTRATFTLAGGLYVLEL